MHTYLLWWKVIKHYKMAEKSEEKIFRWGDYRADLVLYRGCGGVSSEIITLYVGLYSVNHRETIFL